MANISAKKIRSFGNYFISKIRNYSEYQRKTILKSPLFDKDFYIKSAERSGTRVRYVDPVVHYLLVGDRKRISTHPLFDTFYYHDRYRDVEPSGMSALFHYLKYGASEHRDPHPLLDSKFIGLQTVLGSENALIKYLRLPPGTINPHPDIDDKYLAEQLRDKGLLQSNALIDFLEDSTYSVNPTNCFDVRSYAKFNPDAGAYHPFYHFIRFGRNEGRRYDSLEDDVSAMLPQIEEICHLDIDIVPPHTDVLDLPKIRAISAGRDLAVLLKILQKLPNKFQTGHLFFVPHLVFGGAEKVLVNIVTVLTQNKGAQVVIIITDNDKEIASDWLPERDNIKIINIHPFCKNISYFDVLQFLGVYLQFANFKYVYSLNSKTGWDLFERYGFALSKLMKIYGFAFCYDFDAFGRRGGYAWTHLQHCIKFLTGVFTDNDPIVTILAKDLRLKQHEIDKFYVLRQPVEINLGRTYGMHDLIYTENRRAKPTVLWAGRFHKQKNIGSGLKIAALLPQFNFLFAGGSFNDLQDLTIEISDNVTFLGQYDRFDKLIHQKIDLFLHTADWEGLPNVLLEAASHGIPIVARDVGGVSDLVDLHTGWLLPRNASEFDFVDAILSAISSEQETKRKTEVMTAKLRAKYNWEIFSQDFFNAISKLEAQDE